MIDKLSVPQGVEISIPEPEKVPCFRHESEDCPRCDGSSFRLRRVCAGCSEPARTLQAERGAKSPEEAKSLPLYCRHCNPRYRYVDAQWSCLERLERRGA